MYIVIKGLEVFAYHGVHAEEKENGQKFILDIRCLVKDESSCVGDSVGQTASYSAVARTAVRAFTEHKRDLIEAAADDAASAILKEYPIIDGVEVTVKKPDAPVKAVFEYMAVTVSRSREKTEAPAEKEAYLALGSNIGNGAENIRAAYSALNKTPGVRVTAESEMYITKPWGYLEQADFTNACCKVITTLSPEALLGACLGIEAAMGRERTVKNGPRVIDIDVLMYEGQSRDTPELKLPHPGMAEREFVLLPLRDIAVNGCALGFDVEAALRKVQSKTE